MGSSHITEEDIQNYLDGNPLRSKEQFHSHLEECVQCQNRVTEYRMLYGILKNEPEIQLPVSFAMDVVSKMTLLQKTRSRPLVSELFLGVAGFASALITAILIVGWKSILKIVNDIALPKIQFNFNILESAKPLLAGLNGHLYLLFFALITLLTVAAVDRFLRRANQL